MKLTRISTLGLFGGRGLIPPAAAERMEQSRRIGEARGLRLHQRDARLLIGALGVEHGKISDRARLELLARQLKPAIGGLLGFADPRFSASASACSARRLLATSSNAASTVLRYCAKAFS